MLDRLYIKFYVEEGSFWKQKSLPLFQAILIEFTCPCLQFFTSKSAWNYMSGSMCPLHSNRYYLAANEKAFKHYSCWLPFPGISAQRTKHGEKFSWLLDANPNPLEAQQSSYCLGRKINCSHTPLTKLDSDHFVVYSLLNVRLWRTTDFFDR